MLGVFFFSVLIGCRNRIKQCGQSFFRQKSSVFLGHNPDYRQRLHPKPFHDNEPSGPLVVAQKRLELFRLITPVTRHLQIFSFFPSSFFQHDYSYVKLLASFFHCFFLLFRFLLRQQKTAFLCQ